MAKRAGKVSRAQQKKTLMQEDAYRNEVYHCGVDDYEDDTKCMHFEEDFLDMPYQSIDTFLQAGTSIRALLHEMGDAMKDMETVGIPTKEYGEVYMDAGLFQKIAAREYNARGISQGAYEPGEGDHLSPLIWSEVAARIGEAYEPGKALAIKGNGMILEYQVPSDAMCYEHDDRGTINHDYALKYDGESGKLQAVPREETLNTSRFQFPLKNGVMHVIEGKADGTACGFLQMNRGDIGASPSGYYFDSVQQMARYPDDPGTSRVAEVVPNVKPFFENPYEAAQADYSERRKQMQAFQAFEEAGVLALPLNAMGSVSKIKNVFGNYTNVVIGNKTEKGYLCVDADVFFHAAEQIQQADTVHMTDLNQIGVSMQHAHHMEEGDKSSSTFQMYNAPNRMGVGKLPKEAFHYETSIKELARSKSQDRVMIAGTEPDFDSLEVE